VRELTDGSGTPRTADAVALAPSAQRVLEALATVRDPELDEPITELGFIDSCTVSEHGDVEVLLRLPTSQCAPNFAFLMAADARAAIRALAGVRRVRVALEDHCTEEEINAALERGEGFSAAFPGETDDDELAALRELFWRRALLARQSQLARRLLADGWSEARLVGATVAELPDDPAGRRALELRELLGIGTAPCAPALVSATGEPLTESGVRRWLAAGRLVRTSLEANGGICRALIAGRHGGSTYERGGAR